MKKINYYAAIIALTLSSAVMRSQDIHFSQVLEAPLYLSPANTGFFNGYTRAIVNYRNQWASMNKAYQTIGISVDGGLFRSRKRPAFMGLGMTIFRDQAGSAKLRTTTVLVNASGLLKMGKKSALSVGLAGGVAGTNANYDKLTYASQFNGNTFDATANEAAYYRQYTTVDVAAGIAYEFATSKRDPDHDDISAFRIALGAHHLNRPVQDYGAGSKFKMPVRYTAAITSLFDIEDTKFTITPTAIYQLQGNYEELIVGSYVKFRMSTGTKVTGTRTQNAMGVGIFYRRKDALVPKLIFDIGDYSIGMSYDINLSGYRTASRYNGGFEISLRYNNLVSSLFETRREFR